MSSFSHGRNAQEGNSRNLSAFRRLLPLLALAIGLSACSSVRETFDTTRKTPPDEFRVVRQAPLSLPPNYGLRPPDPGAPRPQTGTTTDQARAAVFRQDDSTTAAAAAAGVAASSSRSAGEQALLAKAGAEEVDPAIRQQINQETQQLASQQASFVESLIFWRDPEVAGEIIDPQAEQQRLRENEAMGQPPTAGDTPVIERRRRAIFEGIF